MVGSGAAFNASPFSRRCRALLGFGRNSGTQENLARLLHVSADPLEFYSIWFKTRAQKIRKLQSAKKTGGPKSEIWIRTA